MPPEAPEGPNLTGTTRWLALTTFRLGPLDEAGRARSDAWRDIGFDLDRRVTTPDKSASHEDSCHRVEGAPKSVLADGRDGIDNQFGSQVMSVVKSICSTASTTEAKLDTYTLLLRLDDVGDGDDPSVPGALFVARRTSDKFQWILDDAALEGGDPDRPRTRFPAGFVRDGRWWSGPVSAPVTIELPLCHYSIPATIELRVLTVGLTGGRGMLGGFVRLNALQASATILIRHAGGCPGNATFDQIMNTVTQGLDLVADAPDLQNTSRTCDALSLGLGFGAVPTVAPTQHQAFVVSRPADDCPK